MSTYLIESQPDSRRHQTNRICNVKYRRSPKTGQPVLLNGWLILGDRPVTANELATAMCCPGLYNLPS